MFANQKEVVDCFLMVTTVVIFPARGQRGIGFGKLDFPFCHSIRPKVDLTNVSVEAEPESRFLDAFLERLFAQNLENCLVLPI